VVRVDAVVPREPFDQLGRQREPEFGRGGGLCLVGADAGLPAVSERDLLA
jgi:hypothetical protein